MRISDWSSDVCSSDLDPVAGPGIQLVGNTSGPLTIDRDRTYVGNERKFLGEAIRDFIQILDGPVYRLEHSRNFSVTADWGTIMTFSNVWEQDAPFPLIARSEEHTSELQSLMRISYAAF